MVQEHKETLIKASCVCGYETEDTKELQALKEIEIMNEDFAVWKGVKEMMRKGC
jgi:hypothetical protein